MKEYYSHKREPEMTTPNSHARWTSDEDELALSCSVGECQDLAELLGRSLEAIHVRRSELRRRAAV